MARILSLDTLMQSTLKEFGMDKKAKNYSVITGWEEIVGEKVAAVTLPEKVDKGILTVRVTNPVWKYELTMRKSEILKKIRSSHAGAEVNDIHWK
jgi:predicted nucleic acid-binding Zn ribbon protein